MDQLQVLLSLAKKRKVRVKLDFTPWDKNLKVSLIAWTWTPIHQDPLPTIKASVSHTDFDKVLIGAECLLMAFPEHEELDHD